ncbi:unnamed protein product (macronuclear) [Paramecium tetraurelia]|uniref:FHA domain-containing protein n=1 Tax=Paramecium tetraurelia TaxID=5888 RepID=A0BMI9_PARTE|nr:uncharacterized protein GSPATT00030392001 [Paramecium tetraurelia]CAK59756.1 unnamed protein product [Paramecium tetraurelia]|eukprot:XP_001427154.1 hypothetical protein (macronuclear) [Paramecium tetraurelia strain d4-2]
MKAATWQKDSHGLFDYETQLLTIEKYIILKERKVYRLGQEISTHSPETQQQECQQYLTAVQEKNDEFYINPSGCDENENENFLIVRSLKNSQGGQKGYKMEPGDIIKLGRIEYMIIETRNQDNLVNKAKGEMLKDLVEITASYVTNNQAICRFCLMETQSKEDPFISPCNCKGSCEFVHFSCMRLWIESRCQIKQLNSAQSYRWKQLQCELCESLLPLKIYMEDRELSLDLVQRPSLPYLIMQSRHKNEKKHGKAVYVIQFQNCEPIKIGRGHQCDIQISDISVSRLHAYIKYQDGDFIILDNNSKFGTLVRLFQPYKIEQEKVAVQIGRTVLTFVAKQQSIEDSN